MDAVLKECSMFCGDAQTLCLKTLSRCLRRAGKFHDPALCGSLAACAEACLRVWRGCLEGSVSEDDALHAAAACERCARCCDRTCDDELFSAARLLRACAERCVEASPATARG